MKNYVLKLMDAEIIKLTAQDAATLTQAWMLGKSVIVFNGNAFAAHQICSIRPVSKQEENDMCQIEGFDPKNPPRIETFLSNNRPVEIREFSSNKKLLK